MKFQTPSFAVAAVSALFCVVACSGESATPQPSAGGTAGVGGTASTGGAGSGGGGTPLPATLANFKGILQTSFSGGLCHDAPENHLQMSDNDMLYDTLTTYQTENCGPLITKGNVAQSALVTLLKGDCNGTYRMPLGDCFENTGGTECLSPEEIAAVEAWVAAGAPEN